jgi:sensor histidine kinase YesM
LIIEDDGGDAQSGPAKGAQLGIGNVTERLKAIYSGAASLEAHAKPTGGFLNTIIFPARAPS